MAEVPVCTPAKASFLFVERSGFENYSATTNKSPNIAAVLPVANVRVVAEVAPVTVNVYWLFFESVGVVPEAVVSDLMV